MKKEFPGFFANDGANIEKIWEDCLVVLDANVLLSLYRYSDSTRKDLLDVFASFQDRLWVPHQVVYEYLTNRLGVIAEQAGYYGKAIDDIAALKQSLEHPNQHPFVGSELLKESAGLFDKLTADLVLQKKAHEDRINEDEIKGQLEVLLSERVGPSYDRELTEKLLVSGKSRYEEKIPPGFLDFNKGGDSSRFLDRCKPYGDYIIWNQILEKAKDIKKPVIFITGDVKADWWLQFKGRTIGPLPQLVSEFFEVTDQAFYMYQPARFLTLANDYLSQETSQHTLDEMREVRLNAPDLGLLDLALNKAWPEAAGKEGFHGQLDLGMTAYENWSGEEISAKPTLPYWVHTEYEELLQQRKKLTIRIKEIRNRLDLCRSEHAAMSAYARSKHESQSTLEPADFQKFTSAYNDVDEALKRLQHEHIFLQRKLLDVDADLERFPL